MGMTEQTIPQRLAELARLREQYRAEQAVADATKAEHDRLQKILHEDMKEAGLLTIGTDTDTFTRKSTYYAQVENQDEFIAWAESEGLLEEFTETAAVKGRLNELVRQRLQDGEMLPPGLGFYSKDYISKTQK